MHLNEDCLAPVLTAYGYKRTAWVLANTLNELKWDGRFSPANKQWAERRYIPQVERHKPRSLFGATPPCWMASSVSTARRCRR